MIANRRVGADDRDAFGATAFEGRERLEVSNADGDEQDAADAERDRACAPGVRLATEDSARDGGPDGPEIQYANAVNLSNS